MSIEHLDDFLVSYFLKIKITYNPPCLKIDLIGL